MSAPDQTNPVPEPGPPLDPARKVKVVLCAMALILGFAAIASTFIHGGGFTSVGVWLGVALVGMSGGRLYLILKAGM